jgi:hypothetical protein
MSRKRTPAREAARRRPGSIYHGSIWLDHAELIEEDLEWLSDTERLTLWNVKVPVGLLARIEKLWWLDIRGGSATDLAAAEGAGKLQYLAVNQVRGMTDLSLVAEMPALRYIDLYGLPKVTELPPCAALVNLEHANLGQMRGLVSLHGLLQAPNLRELKLSRKINVSETDVNGIIGHPAIEAFSWFAEDVPSKVWVPVVEKIGLPEVPVMFPETWFRLPGFTID